MNVFAFYQRLICNVR